MPEVVREYDMRQDWTVQRVMCQGEALLEELLYVRLSSYGAVVAQAIDEAERRLNAQRL